MRRPYIGSILMGAWAGLIVGLLRPALSSGETALVLLLYSGVGRRRGGTHRMGRSPEIVISSRYGRLHPEPEPRRCGYPAPASRFDY
jgi:hypothetical protein